MRKILTLALTAFFAVGTWAQNPTLPADGTPTETLDVLTGDENVATKLDTKKNSKHYLVYDLGTEIRTNALKGGKAKWVAGPKNDGGSSVSSITFADDVTDAEKYGFSTSSLNKWGIHSGRYVGFRVKNCSEAAVSTKSNGSNNNKTLQLQVYVKNGDAWDFVEAIGAEKYNNSNAYVLTSSTLDDKKEYVILLTSGASSGSDAYEFRLASGTIPVSTDATLGSVKVGETELNINKFEEKDGALQYNYELTLGTAEVPEVTYTTNDKYATAVKTDAADVNGTTTIVVTAEDETTTLTYKINFSVKTSLSTDATLSDLKVNGTTQTDFAADKYEYNVNLGVYEAIEVSATTNDAGAKAVVTPDAENNKVVVVVTAEDGEATKTYTVNYTRDAATPLAEISDDTTWDFTKTGANTQEYGDATLPTKSEEFVFADVLSNPDASFNAAALAGIMQYSVRDGKYCQGTQLRFKTTVAGTVEITYSNTGNNGARYATVNGSQIAGDTGSSNNKDADIVNPSAAVLAGEVTIGVSTGMLRFYKIVFTKDDGGATAIDNTEASVKATKVIRDGQVLILRDGKFFNTLGVEVK